LLYTTHTFVDGTKKDLLNMGDTDGIPAKEIKLAKILMDKPAPHCSA